MMLFAGTVSAQTIFVSTKGTTIGLVPIVGL